MIIFYNLSVIQIVLVNKLVQCIVVPVGTNSTALEFNMRSLSGDLRGD